MTGFPGFNPGAAQLVDNRLYGGFDEGEPGDITTEVSIVIGNLESALVAADDKLTRFIGQNVGDDVVEIALQFTDATETVPLATSGEPTGSALFPIATVAVATTLNAGHYVVLVSAAVTITLPAAANHKGRNYYVKSITQAGTVTVDANSTELIDGVETQDLLAEFDSIHIVCNGTAWFII